MAKKLYHVRVVLYVMAENEAEACMAATQAQFDIFECAARKADSLDPQWYEAIPYNADDERTCAEIMAGEQRLQLPDVHPVKLPARVEASRRPFNANQRYLQAGQPAQSAG